MGNGSFIDLTWWPYVLLLVLLDIENVFKRNLKRVFDIFKWPNESWYFNYFEYFLNVFIRLHWTMRQHHTKANQNNSLLSTISAFQLKYAKYAYEWWMVREYVWWHWLCFAGIRWYFHNFRIFQIHFWLTIQTTDTSWLRTLFRVHISSVDYTYTHIILFEHEKCSYGSYNPSIFNRPNTYFCDIFYLWTCIFRINTWQPCSTWTISHNIFAFG